MDSNAITPGPARTSRVGRLATLCFLALATAGLPGCDEATPTGTDLTTSSEGAQADIETGPAAAAAATLSTITLPINQSQAAAGVLFGLTQTGAGPAGSFKISQASNLKDALLGQSAGQGNALHGLTTGLGHAAVFEATNPSSIVSAVAVIAAGSGEGLRVQHRGLGPAGFFENVNGNSAANTMELRSIGKGRALNASSAGIGPAIVATAGSGGAVLGSSSTGIGGFFFNSSASTVSALLVRTGGSDFAARFQAIGSASKGVLIETKGGAGLQVVGGSKNAVVRTPSGAKALYTEESTEVWFTDYGFGRLANGRLRVLLDPSFAQTINPDEPYHVFLQARGRAELYVGESTPLGFEVVLKDGDPRAEFSYRIVAKRLGFEQKRLEPAPWLDRLDGAGGPNR
jgi:hypothetical protein